jgi:transcriptional regulator with XRE-family HTH domain
MDFRDYYRLNNPVRALRKETGLTQVELAKRLGTKQPSISRKEAGEETTIGWLKEAARVAGRTLRIRFAPFNAPYYEMPPCDPRFTSSAATSFHRITINL